MAEVRQLARFSITEADEGYRLRIEDDVGRVLELMADDEQIDQIIDALDAALGDEDFEDDGEAA